MSQQQIRIAPWHDRNPIGQSNHYSAGITPSAEVQRISYICPAEKIAFIELLGADILRVTDATALGNIYARWYHKFNEQEKLLMQLRLRDKAKDASKSKEIGGLILTEGQKISGTTEDACTDGSSQILLNYKLTVFDVFPVEFIITPFQMTFPKKDLQQPREKPWWQWW